jgi:hypothetical protein
VLPLSRLVPATSCCAPGQRFSPCGFWRVHRCAVFQTYYYYYYRDYQLPNFPIQLERPSSTTKHGFPVDVLIPTGSTMRAMTGVLKHAVVARGRAYIIGGGFCTIFGAVCMYRNGERGVVRSMVCAFEIGGELGWEEEYARDASANVNRDSTEAGIKKLFFDLSPGYPVVVGASGSGKSTAIRHVINALAAPKGVAYFSAPELSMDFSKELAKTLGYFTPLDVMGRIHRTLTGETKEERSSPPLNHEPHATWSTLRPFILKAAMQFHLKHGIVPVLVLDAMDIIAREDKTVSFKPESSPIFSHSFLRCSLAISFR